MDKVFAKECESGMFESESEPRKLIIDDDGWLNHTKTFEVKE